MRKKKKKMRATPLGKETERKEEKGTSSSGRRAREKGHTA